MRAALHRAWIALHGFARGFLGLAAPPPQAPRELREHFGRRARGRTPCC